MKLLITGSVLLAACTLAYSETANFDDLTEGALGTSFTDGGITFSNNDLRIDDGVSVPPYLFSIDNASGDSRFMDHGATSPNVMSTAGFGNGDTAGAGRMGEFWMTAGHDSTFGSLDFFGDANGNSVTLEAYENGVLVGSDTVTPDLYNVHLYRLSVGGVSFDTLRLTASGPNDNGAAFGDMDNVHIQGVPEPATMAGLALGALALIKRRKKSS
jgi:hypothetical protein